MVKKIRGHRFKTISKDTEERILHLAAVGIPIAHIAKVVTFETGENPSPDWIKKHCGDLIEEGITEANFKVSNALYKNAIDGNLNAQIWWEKSRQGRSDKIETVVAPTDQLTNLLSEIAKSQANNTLTNPNPKLSNYIDVDYVNVQPSPQPNPKEKEDE